jgi:hypothetical protein
MTQTFKAQTVFELVEQICEENYSHIEFMDNMGGDPCDCRICTTLNTIMEYWGE